MFTGIVKDVGRIRQARAEAGVRRLRIAAGPALEGLKVGDSVAVAGCCLTAVAVDDAAFEVELSEETLAKTAARWEVGQRVNLERALRADGRFDGHIVSGHVEGVGRVLEVRRPPGSVVITVDAPASMARALIPKGSITVDGVSLTLVDVGGPGGSVPQWPARRFSLWLIPHTLAVTTLGDLREGSEVNLESDVLARYAERRALLAAAEADA